MAGGDISLVCIIEDVTFIFSALQSSLNTFTNSLFLWNMGGGWGSPMFWKKSACSLLLHNLQPDFTDRPNMESEHDRIGTKLHISRQLHPTTNLPFTKKNSPINFPPPLLALMSPLLSSSSSSSSPSASPLPTIQHSTDSGASAVCLLVPQRQDHQLRHKEDQSLFWSWWVKANSREKTITKLTKIGENTKKTSSRLVIEKIQKSDSGNYTCRSG